MRFRLLDLIIATTVIGVVIGAFGTELLLGVQLATLLTVCVAATSGSLLLRRYPMLGGAIGGLIAVVISLSAMYPYQLELLHGVNVNEYEVLTLSSHIYRFDFLGRSFSIGPIHSYTLFYAKLAAAWMIVSPMLGAAIGPMGSLSLQHRGSLTRTLDDENHDWGWRKSLLVSWALLAAVVLFLFLEMGDRSAMQSTRNWLPMRIIAAITFVLYSYHWIRRVDWDSRSVSPTHESVDIRRSGVRSAIILFVIAFSIVDSTTPATGQEPGVESVPKKQPPNIVFIFSDDHATNAISAYGSRLKDTAPTPNIDRIAREGALFRNSFCANSICGPSRACILTGKHSHVNGFMRNGNKFDATQWTFVRELQEAGYQTALLGKWHLNTDPVGFDFWEILPGQGNYYNPDFIRMDGSRYRQTGYCTDLVTDKAIDWLKQRKPDQPFLLMCQHKAPHRTFSPALRHLDAFENVDIPEPDTLFDDYANRSQTLADNEMSLAKHFDWMYDLKLRKDEHEGIELPGPDRYPAIEYRRMNEEQKSAWDKHFGPLNQQFLKDYQAGRLNEQDIVRWKYQRYMKNYLGTIKSVDESVGRLLNYLDKHDLVDNTIVIYSSDQGFYLGEHGWYDKRWMFEESLQMPFVIRWPGVVKPGLEPQDLIQNIDYAPTFLQAAGLAVPEAVQGQSLLPVLMNDPRRKRREAIYYGYYEVGEHNVPQHFGIRTNAHKLMYFPNTDEWNLFDLQRDPHEMNNVFDDSRYLEIREKLTDQFRQLRAKYDAPPMK